MEGDPGSDWLWCIDPLDGTTNFAHGYPSFATSIGAVTCCMRTWVAGFMPKSHDMTRLSHSEHPRGWTGEYRLPRWLSHAQPPDMAR